jgi:regulator of cell morphogenesis and NO signaling
MQILNITLLEPKRKHPTIFEWFDALQPGEAFTILNDHDPKPLYYQMMGERGNVFSWTYEENGPEWWRVVIKKNHEGDGPLLGEIAASDLRKIEVFKKYGIDFSCGGKKSLRQACDEKDIDVNELENELEKVRSTSATPAFDFNQWEVGFLADYIYNQHHLYYYKQEKTLDELFEIVAGKNVSSSGNLQLLWNRLKQELRSHFIKEERIIFPMIRQAAESVTNNTPLAAELQQIREPLQLMETDHEIINAQATGLANAVKCVQQSSVSENISELKQNLQALIDDLQLHLHLENNILFPKALLLEKQMKAAEVKS